MKKFDRAKIFGILEKFNQQEIAVIGDLMLDRYIFGKVERISPEAPVPVVNVTHETKVPGGAANVALNLVKMSAASNLSGVIGHDEDGKELKRLLNLHKIGTSMIVENSLKPTTRKVRIIGHSQNLLRIDYEDTSYIDAATRQNLLATLQNSIKSAFLVVSDYAKGTLPPVFITNLIAWANENNIKVIVDPKPQHCEYYRNCYLITPNKKEAQEMTGIVIRDENTLLTCGNALRQKLNCLAVITLGEEGMAVFDQDGSMHKIPTRAREVYDVSGAGDTVMAGITLSLCSGSTLREAAEIANVAAGIKVSKVGTQPVSLAEIQAFLNQVL